MMSLKRRSSDAPRNGFTVIELMIVLSIVAIVASTAIPMSTSFSDGQRLRTTAQKAQAALTYAHDEAIRSGNLHVVFFASDTSDNALVDGNGDTVDVLVIDEGPARFGEPELPDRQRRGGARVHAGTWRFLRRRVRKRRSAPRRRRWRHAEREHLHGRRWQPGPGGCCSDRKASPSPSPRTARRGRWAAGAAEST